jgi:hypothetical protein
LTFIAVASALLLGACVNANPTGGGGPLGVEADDGQAPILSPLSDVTTTTEPPRACPTTPLSGDIALVDDPALATLRLSQAIYPCVADLVVSSPDARELAAASEYALAGGLGLLVVDTPPSPEQVAEIDRLSPETIRVFGVDATAIAGSWEIVDGATVDPNAPTTTEVTETTTTAAGGTAAPVFDHVWLVADGSRLTTAIAPAALAAQAEIVEIAVDDLRSVDEATRERISGAESVRLMGSFDADASWQLDVVRSGVEVPGGGQLVFPGRRFVAFYGNPLTSALGVLGEQGPESTLDRLREVAALYETDDGVVVVPTFEIIVTVASAQAGGDNDYSSEMAIADIQPWVDLAAEAGAYVVLDLQPGRADFLSQAKLYESLLRLPHVGLALDPEWRLKPDQVHLRQIGTVTAAEINTVSEWLAGIVREEALPQKLFIVHQFRFSMITERETIETPPELAVVLQMDGQGPLTTKYQTYDVLTAGTEDAGWLWGWKNFYDEDSPTATPTQTLEVDPQPVFISYQ